MKMMIKKHFLDLEFECQRMTDHLFMKCSPFLLVTVLTLSVGSAFADSPFNSMPAKCGKEVKDLIQKNLGSDTNSLISLTLYNDNEVGLSRTNAHWQKNVLAEVKYLNKDLEKCIKKTSKIKNSSTRNDEVHGCYATFNNEMIEMDKTLGRAIGDILSYSSARSIYEVALGRNIDKSQLYQQSDLPFKIKDTRIKSTKSYFLFRSHEKQAVLDMTCVLAGQRKLQDSQSYIVNPKTCNENEHEPTYARIDYDKNGHVNALFISEKGGTVEKEYVLNSKCKTELALSWIFGKGQSVEELNPSLCEGLTKSDTPGLVLSSGASVKEKCRDMNKKSSPPSSSNSVR